MAATEYFVLSNVGTRYFKLAYTDSDTVPASATSDDEITSVISCNIGTFNKETTKYRTLNGNGWESIATLGNSSDDATFECVREGTGDVYSGVAGDSSYTRIKNWFMQATRGAGVASPACIVEVTPRGGTGETEYEGTCYFVVPNQWSPGTKDTETGQEYSFTVSPFGPQIPLKVTHTAGATDTWSFTKATLSA